MPATKPVRRGTKPGAGKAKAEGTISIKRILSKEIVDGEERDIEFDAEMFETTPAVVEVRAGATRSIADFESIRVDVGISMPCYKERVQETFDAVAEQVAELLGAEIDNYLGEEGEEEEYEEEGEEEELEDPDEGEDEEEEEFGEDEEEEEPEPEPAPRRGRGRARR